MSVETATAGLREKTQDAAKRHKASWIELGQYLFSIHKDKLYKTWGFLTFDTYCRKELGIKETTAAKLLKSYSYLEREEPRLAKAASPDSDEDIPSVIPHYESVNMLRLAKDNKRISPQDFAQIRNSVINSGKEPKEVKMQVRNLLSEQEVKDPAEVRRTRRNAAIKRIVSVINMAKKELENEDLLPDYLIKQMSQLVEKLQDQIEA
jgi:hypothetical protein